MLEDQKNGLGLGRGAEWTWPCDQEGSTSEGLSALRCVRSVLRAVGTHRKGLTRE